MKSSSKSNTKNVSQFTCLLEMERSLEVSDYYLDRLSKQHRQKFEASLKTDKALQHGLAEEKSFAEGIAKSDKHYTVSESNFDQFNQQLSNAIAQQQASVASKVIKGTTQSFYKRLSGIAASIALLVSVGFIASNQLFLDANNNQTGFRTLSNDKKFIDNSSHLLYRVIFSDRFGSQTVENIAGKYGFSLIQGPDEKNSYLVEVEQPLSEVEQGLLRDTDEIIFIEKALVSYD